MEERPLLCKTVEEPRTLFHGLTHIPRNELLNKTDRYFLIDYPIEYEQQMIIKKYRQDLRDFINENEIKILAGEKVDFPKQPDFIDLNIIY